MMVATLNLQPVMPDTALDSGLGMIRSGVPLKRATGFRVLGFRVYVGNKGLGFRYV